LDFEEQSSYRGGLRRAGEVRRASPDARRLVPRGDQRDDGPQRPRRRSRKLWPLPVKPIRPRSTWCASRSSAYWSGFSFVTDLTRSAVDFRLGPNESAQLYSIGKRNQAGRRDRPRARLGVRIAYVTRMFLDALIKHKE